MSSFSWGLVGRVRDGASWGAPAMGRSSFRAAAVDPTLRRFFGVRLSWRLPRTTSPCLTLEEEEEGRPLMRRTRSRAGEARCSARGPSAPR